MTDETPISPQTHADARPLTELDLACAAGTLLHSVRHPAAILTVKGKFVLANQALLEELACSSAVLTGRPLQDVINATALRRLKPLIDMASRGKPAMAEGMFAFDEGRGAPMRLSCTPLRTAGASRQTRLLFLELRELAFAGPAERRMRLAQQAAHLMAGRVLMLGRNGRVAEVLPVDDHDPQLATLQDLDPAALTGVHLAELAGHELFRRSLEPAFEAALAGARTHVELSSAQLTGALAQLCQRRAGAADEDQTLAGLVLTFAPSRDWVGRADGVMLLLGTAIGTRQEPASRTRELERMAMEDPLTGLANRRAFQLALDEQLARARAGASAGITVLVLDLDQFKIINDRAGHMAGDAMLERIAAQLQHLAGETALAARLGGDEFAIIRFSADEGGAHAFAQVIASSLAQFSFPWDGAVYRTGCSIGFAVLDRQFARTLNASAADVLHWADQACLSSKALGGGKVQQFRFDEHLLSAYKASRSNLDRIEQALAGDRLQLFAQPVCCTATGRTLMTELLLRVEDEELGLLEPQGVLAAAARHGLLPQVDQRVIELALVRLRRGGRAAAGYFSINLSEQSLASPDFLAFLDGALSRHRAIATRLAFEVSELAVARETAGMARLAAILRTHGAALVLDDFAGNWPKTAHLKGLGFSWLKIDGSITANVLTDRVQRAQIRGIVQVAATLGARVIAEAVENEDTAVCLAELGVFTAQGFHFGIPQPWTSAADLLKKAA